MLVLPAFLFLSVNMLLVALAFGFLGCRDAWQANGARR